jgi:hypothetical protein
LTKEVSGYSSIELPTHSDTDTDDPESEPYRAVSFPESPAEYDVSDHTDDCGDDSDILENVRRRGAP